MTPATAAERLGLPAASVRYMIRMGRLPAKRVGIRRFLIAEEALEAMLAESDFHPVDRRDLGAVPGRLTTRGRT